MSKRVDITGEIFDDIYVLEFKETINTHAHYQCLCMLCNQTFRVSYSNLVRRSSNTKSCTSCGNKKVTNGEEQDIYWDLKNGLRICEIIRKYSVSNSIVYRVKKSI